MQDTSMPITHALVRLPEKSWDQSNELRKASVQHDQLCKALYRCGIKVKHLAEHAADIADTIVQDSALITERVTIIGELSKKTSAIGGILARNNIIKRILTPGTFDARDVVRIHDHFYIGISSSTNTDGANQVAYILKEFGYEATLIELDKKIAPNLSDALAYVGKDTVLLHKKLENHFAFIAYKKITVPAKDRHMIDALLVNDMVLLPYGYDDIKEKIEKETGNRVIDVPTSEFAENQMRMKNMAILLPKKKKPTIAANWAA